MKRYRALTAEEKHIVIDKGTEPPGSGAYERLSAPGIYTCKRCDAPLFLSSHKFLSNCGWPSFDDAIASAVLKTPDADGVRTEITCARCGGHLGHVFSNEGYTPKNLRHCVNSKSLNFIPALVDEDSERGFFAGGCFWGVEYLMAHISGVERTRVGYMGGHVANPSYEEVCSFATGHLEVVEVTFDRRKTSYQEICKVFFEIHDPTDLEGQGPDRGPQYGSAIFYLTREQQRAAEQLKKQLKEASYAVVTEIRPAETFYEAEPYHQAYYEKTGDIPYCHKRVRRFEDRPPD